MAPVVPDDPQELPARNDTVAAPAQRGPGRRSLRIQADEVVERIGRTEAELRRLEHVAAQAIQTHEAAIAQIKQELADEATPLEAQLRQDLRSAYGLYRRLIRNGHGSKRSVTVPAGQLAMKLDTNWTTEVVGSEEDAIKAVRVRGLRYLTFKVTLNKTAIAKDRKRFRRLPNLRIFRKDRFRVIPALLDGQPEPKESRLRVPVETLLNN